MSLCAMKLHGTREPTVIGHESGKDKNQNIFCFSTHLDKFTSLSVSDTLFVNVFCKFSRSRKQIYLLSFRLIEIL